MHHLIRETADLCWNIDSKGSRRYISCHDSPCSNGSPASHDYPGKDSDISSYNGMILNNWSSQLRFSGRWIFVIGEDRMGSDEHPMTNGGVHGNEDHSLDPYIMTNRGVPFDIGIRTHHHAVTDGRFFLG